MTSHTNDRRKDLPMWMDAYLQDVLLRERMAEAQACADRDHLLRRLRRPRTQRSPFQIFTWLRRAPRRLTEARHA